MPKLNLAEAAKEIMQNSINKSGSEKAESIKDPKENDTGDAITKNTDDGKNYNKDVSKNEDEQTSSADTGDKTAEKLSSDKKPPKNSKGAPEVDNDGKKVNEEADCEDDDIKYSGKDVKKGDGEADDEEEDDDKNMKESLVNKLDSKISIDISEDIAAMFKGANLSDEFVERATTIFEAAVTRKVKEVSRKLAEEGDKIISAQIDSLEEQMSEEIEDFMKLVASEWLSENEVSIENNLRTELTEDFIYGLRNLFAESYIEIPEDKVDVVAELSRVNEELEASLNEEVAEKIENHKYTQELERKLAFIEIMEDRGSMTLSQREKIKELAEDITFDSIDKYKTKINTLIENYIDEGGKTDNKTRNDEADFITEEVIDTSVSAFAKALGMKKTS